MFFIHFFVAIIKKRGYITLILWGYSSVGRALQWHCRGQEFDPPYLHHLPLKLLALRGFLCLFFSNFCFSSQLHVTQFRLNIRNIIFSYNFFIKSHCFSPQKLAVRQLYCVAVDKDIYHYSICKIFHHFYPNGF